MFLKRSYKPELMDDFSINDERIDRALIELKIINRFLGGNSTSKNGFKEISRKINLDEETILLDVGAGASDIILSLRKNYRVDKIYTLDLNGRACRFAKNNSPSLITICGNVLTLPFNKNKFDLIHASLFFHHFNENEVKNILITLLTSAKHAIIINDLRRSLFAFWGIKILTALFSKSEFVKKDGPLSVKRAFVKNDLLKILNELKINQYTIKRKWAFRWLVIIYKDKVNQF